MSTIQLSNVCLTRPDALAALRGATERLHSVVDQSMPLSAAQPTLDDYAAHLRLLAAWLAPIELWLAAYRDGPQDPRLLAPIDHAALVAADLAHHLTPLVPRAPSASSVPWPSRASAAFRWGVCYVIEGSQLGGAVLYKRLHARLAPHPLDYLGKDGAQVAARWKAFLNSMQQELASPEQVEEACRGAQAGFEHLLALISARDTRLPVAGSAV